MATWLIKSSLRKWILWGMLESAVDFYVHAHIRQCQILGGNLS